MRLPHTAQTSRPWRIHELTRDFRLEDVWALPTPGGADDFPRLLELITSLDPSDSSPVVRALFAVRWKLGALFGWDDSDGGAGPGRPTLRDRMPADLRDSAAGPALAVAPFTTLYRTDTEWAAEVANRTVHGVLHIGWVPDGGCYRGQLSVYVQPNGLLGSAYMAAITPFRYVLVYPLLLRSIGREWQSREQPVSAS